MYAWWAHTYLQTCKRCKGQSWKVSQTDCCTSNLRPLCGETGQIMQQWEVEARDAEWSVQQCESQIGSEVAKNRAQTWGKPVRWTTKTHFRDLLTRSPRICGSGWALHFSKVGQFLSIMVEQRSFESIMCTLISTRGMLIMPFLLPWSFF